MISKCVGGKEKEKRAKKSIFKKKVGSAVSRHYGSVKRSVWG